MSVKAQLSDVLVLKEMTKVLPITPLEFVQHGMKKRIADVPVHQFQGDTVEAAMTLMQECVSERIVEQIVDVTSA